MPALQKLNTEIVTDQHQPVGEARLRLSDAASAPHDSPARQLQMRLEGAVLNSFYAKAEEPASPAVFHPTFSPAAVMLGAALGGSGVVVCMARLLGG